MLKYCRIFVLLVLGILGFFLALLICLPRPFNPRNTSLVTRYILAPAARIVGLKIHMEEPEFLAGMKSAVYAGNHQSNWDIVALAPCVRPGVIAIGKKSLVWVPLFGLIYFLAGNVRLDRENKQKAMETMNKVSQDLGSGKYSIWIFPEGTRSKGTGLGKFKPGAIVTASEAGVPLVPIVASTYFDDFDMNRWNNGHVLIKYLDPIEYPKFDMKNKEEKELVDAGNISACTLLKAGHHGDSKTLTTEFLMAARPQAAVICTSTAQEPDTPAQDPAACPAERCHKVTAQETVTDIQIQHNKSLHTLEVANPQLDLDNLKEGDTVCVPPVNLPCALPGSAVIAEGDTLESLANRYRLSLAQLLRANPCLAPDDFVPGVTIKLPQ